MVENCFGHSRGFPSNLPNQFQIPKVYHQQPKEVVQAAASSQQPAAEPKLIIIIEYIDARRLHFDDFCNWIDQPAAEAAEAATATASDSKAVQVNKKITKWKWAT